MKNGPSFNWEDPLLLDEQLTEEERMVRDSARAYAQDKLMPRVLEAIRHENFDREIMNEMGALGFLGSTIDGYGCAGVNYVCYGLIAREVERVDSGYRSAMSVQSILVMHPIHAFGTEAQRQKYLPKLATGEMVGCFGLTEPDHGSDPGGMKTARARRSPAAMSSTAPRCGSPTRPIADVFVVWAKTEDGVHPRLHPRERHEGPHGAEDRGQVQPARLGHRRDRHGRRRSCPRRTCCPTSAACKGPFACLNNARYGIAWGALGAAEFCWHAARNYTLDRKQFGRPLAANQLIQKKLADMQTEITLGLQACLRLGRLKDEGTRGARDGLAAQAQQLRQGARHRPHGARHAWRQRHRRTNST